MNRRGAPTTLGPGPPHPGAGRPRPLRTGPVKPGRPEAGRFGTVVSETEAAGPAETAWVANQRKWARGWRRTIFPGIFLVYLVQVVGATADDSRGAAAIAGYVIVAGFGVCYLLVLPLVWQELSWRFWAFYSALVALWLAELPFAHADAFVMCVFIVAVTVARLGSRSTPIVVAMTVAAVLVPAAIPSWHDGLNTAVDNGTVITIPTIALAMFGFFELMRGNLALAQARSELAPPGGRERALSHRPRPT